MRVLHLHSGNQFGGIERLLSVLAQYNNRESGLTHAFGLCFEGRSAVELRHHGVRVTSLGPVRLSRPHSILRARAAAQRLLDQEKPDVVITHLPWSRVVFAPVLRRTGTREVHWVHGASPSRTWLDRLADRSRPDAVVYNSQFTATVSSNRYSGIPSRTLYDPVTVPRPAEPRSAVRERCATDPESLVIVQISRLDPSKGHLDLVEAARLLPNAIPWVIWLAGGPNTPAQRRYYQRLQETVGHLGLAHRFRFLGEVADVSSMLHASDIFCHPSRTGESFGIVFVEAMCAAVPVVATDVGAASEVVTPDCGILVPVLDPGSLSEALTTLAGSPDKRHEAGAAGRRRSLALSDPAARIADLREALRSFAERDPR